MLSKRLAEVARLLKSSFNSFSCSNKLITSWSASVGGVGGLTFFKSAFSLSVSNSLENSDYSA